MLLSAGYAQVGPVPVAPVDTSVGQPVLINYAERFDYEVYDTTTIQRLAGEVELQQDSALIFCDTATITGDVFVEAVGNVVIRQNDTISIFADSLDYYADQQIAYLLGNVVLVNGEQQLFTQALRYDLATKRATYTTRAKLTDGTSQLSSLRGSYDVEAAFATFRDSVFVVADNFNLIADTLGFATEARIVYFEGPTVMATPQSKGYCEDGFYSLADTVGRFAGNAQVQRGSQRATADTIDYFGPAGEFVLEGRARFADGTQRAAGKRIVYNEQLNSTVLTGDASFTDGPKRISGQRIDYDGGSQTFATGGGVDLSEPPYLLIADSLWYDEVGGFAHVQGNVVWQDTASQHTITAERVDYQSVGDYVKAFGGRPVFSTVVDADTLSLSADTLFTFLRPPSLPATVLADDSTNVEGMVGLDSLLSAGADSMKNVAPLPDSTSIAFTDSLNTDEAIGVDSLLVGPRPEADSVAADSPVAAISTDSVRMLLAYPAVRIYKSNLQAVCDSLAYDGRDSAFTLFGAPLMWSDTSQFAADTITIRLRNGNIDGVALRTRAMIVNSTDELFFNQVKGRRVNVEFTEGDIRQVLVLGNAESVYYVLDEAKAYVGVNHVRAARMRMAFAEGEMSDLYFYDQPAGDISPLAPFDQEPKLLEDFRWERKLRPKSLQDLLPY